MVGVRTRTMVLQSRLAERDTCREDSRLIPQVDFPVSPDSNQPFLCSTSALFKRNVETVGTKQSVKEEQKTIYDMITHLSGHSLPGIPQNSVPPKKMDEATKQYLWQHRLLLLFLK